MAPNLLDPRYRLPDPIGEPPHEPHPLLAEGVHATLQLRHDVELERVQGHCGGGHHPVLNQEEGRFLWVFRSRRYPTIDGKVEQEVKLRIMSVLLSDSIPDPRDIVIIGLVDSCGIFSELLSARELERARDRIDQVRKLDLIGQAVAKSVWEIQASLAMTAHPVF